MFPTITKNTFSVLSLITLVCIAVLTVSCAKSGQPSNESKASAPSAASSSGGDFEGMIAMKMEDEDQKGIEMNYFLKGRHTRIEAKMGDTPDEQAVMLWDLESSRMTTLMPARKMYLTMDLKETAEGLKGVAKGKQSDEEDMKFPKLTPTGKQETIAGHTCEHWLIGDEQDIDMCVAKGLGFFGMGGQSGGGLGLLKNLSFSPKLLDEAAAHPEWVKFLEGGAFPLKVTATENGKVTMSMEATKIERKSLDDSLFVVPADFKELKMPNLPAGKQ